MNSKKSDRPISILKQTSPLFLRISLLPGLLLAACSPPIAPSTQAPVADTPKQIPDIPTGVLPTPTSEPSPSSTPEGDPGYPYYLPLTFKPDVEPQTINGVTTTIDWAYADDSRVAIHYTISGLDWPEEASTEPTQMDQMTSETIPDWSASASWRESASTFCFH